MDIGVIIAFGAGSFFGTLIAHWVIDKWKNRKKKEISK